MNVDIVIIIVLSAIIYKLRQKINKEKFAATSDQGTQFNTLVDSLRDGVIPGNLKITGTLNVKGNIYFHDYVLNNAWTGFASAAKLYDPINVRPFITATQENSSIVMGGTNETGNLYWYSYAPNCAARDGTCATRVTTKYFG